MNRIERSESDGSEWSNPHYRYPSVIIRTETLDLYEGRHPATRRRRNIEGCTIHSCDCDVRVLGSASVALAAAGPWFQSVKYNDLKYRTLE